MLLFCDFFENQRFFVVNIINIINNNFNPKLRTFLSFATVFSLCYTHHAN